MDYGMKTENPIDRVSFYRKGDKEAFKISRGQVRTLPLNTIIFKSMLVQCKHLCNLEIIWSFIMVIVMNSKY